MGDWALILIVVIVALGPLAWAGAIAGSIDAVQRPTAVWTDAGCRKSRWVWQAAGVACFPLALIYSGWYFTRIRPRLLAAARPLGIGYPTHELEGGAPDGAFGAEHAAIGGSDAAMRTVKIRAHPAYRVLSCVPVAVFIVSAALPIVGSHRFPPLFLEIEWVVFGCFFVGMSSWFGVNLTSRGVVVNSLRRRHIDWRQIQAVTEEPFMGGTRVVLWTTAGDRVPLREPIVDFTSLGRRRFERGFHLIGQTWLARRGTA